MGGGGGGGGPRQYMIWHDLRNLDCGQDFGPNSDASGRRLVALLLTRPWQIAQQVCIIFGIL